MDTNIHDIYIYNIYNVAHDHRHASPPRPLDRPLASARLFLGPVCCFGAARVARSPQKKMGKKKVNVLKSVKMWETPRENDDEHVCQTI